MKKHKILSPVRKLSDIQTNETGNAAFSQTSTSGVGFQFSRNLAAASTDSPVVKIINDNDNDDKEALYIQHDPKTGNYPAITVDTKYSATAKAFIFEHTTVSNAGFVIKWLNGITRYGFQLGNGTTLYRMWVDDSGNFRIHNNDPTAHDQGTVVGTQT